VSTTVRVEMSKIVSESVPEGRELNACHHLHPRIDRTYRRAPPRRKRANMQIGSEWGGLEQARSGGK